jgi:hypothetical protein
MDDENDSLYTIPDEAEIFVAISDLGFNKAPDPGLFYKSYWPIVKSSVISWFNPFLEVVLCSGSSIILILLLFLRWITLFWCIILGQ